MKVKVEELSPVLRKLSVEVPADTVDRALSRAYRAVGRKARIKGFRPGKVPRKILEQYYGHQVAHEVAEELVRETYPQVVEQESLEPVSMPQVEDSGHVHAGEAWNYTARIEVIPPVKITHYEGLEGERLKVEARDEEIDQEVERLQQAMAQLVPVEDREVVEKGDFVTVDMAATLGGKPFEAGTGEGMTFEVSDGTVLRGELPEAVGAKVGDVVKVEHVFESDHTNDEVRGKSAHFEATVRQIKRRELPPIDDELAKDLGEDGIDSLLALRGHIRQRILDQRKASADRRLKDSLVASLVDKNPIDVPPALIDRTAEAMVRPFIQQMLQAGIDPKQLQESMDLSQMVTEARPRAESVVKGALLLEALAKAESLEVTEDDREAHYAEIAEESGQPLEKVRANFNKDPKELESLDKRLLEDKALAFIQERASIKEIEPGKDEDDSDVSGEAEKAPETAKKKSSKKKSSKKS